MNHQKTPKVIAADEKISSPIQKIRSAGTAFFENSFALLLKKYLKNLDAYQSENNEIIYTVKKNNTVVAWNGFPVCIHFIINEAVMQNEKINECLAALFL
jgi:hypothetical protein